EPRDEQLTEPGFCLLTLWFRDDGGMVWNRTPMTLSYRQPLARLGGERCFFYMPVFEDLPEGFSTTDTNRYSLTFDAVGCSLAITNGAQTALIGNGCSATFAPEIHQPFRGVSKVAPNQRSGPFGSEPSSSK